MSAWSERVYRACLRAYPRGFRNEYSSELRAFFRDLSRRAEYRGPIGRVRLWLFVARDLVTSIARERVSELPGRSVPMHRARVREWASVPYGDALIASLAVLALYIATLAPTVAFWDTGEYMTAAYTLGIPHPPGNPLFVLVSALWLKLWSPTGLAPAIVLNLFSAFASAAAHFCWFLVADRIAGAVTSDARTRRIAAAIAVLLSATTFTVWNQSNVNEKVYTLSLFTVALTCWLLLRWRETNRSTTRLLVIVFLLALTSTNHLMGVLVAPAALLFIAMVHRRAFVQRRLWIGAPIVIAIGMLPQFFLPLRAAQNPVLNESDPSCASFTSAVASIYTWGAKGCPALSATLKREQYDKPSIKLDPTVYPDYELPRGPKLIAHQFANYAQYFNWQWGRSIGGADPLTGGARPIVTIVFLLLGLAGARAHWRRDRASAAFTGVLFLTLSAGLVVYLNFKYGYAMAWDAFPDSEMHEVRERDYFFLISFCVWAMWAGVGLVHVWQRAAAYLRQRVRFSDLVTAPMLGVAIVPLSLNWEWASRRDDYTARDWAYNLLMSVEPYGVLITNGDNDTFPLWYLQEVEGIRRDVTVAVTSYLNTAWYAKQLRDLTTPCEPGEDPERSRGRIVCQRPYRDAGLALMVAPDRATDGVPDREPGRAFDLAANRAQHRAPKDSILPLTDEQIESIASGGYVLQNAVTLKAGALRANIPAGTQMLPADTFIAAIVQAAIDDRPIHFSTPSPAVQKLGLFPYTVRSGLSFRLDPRAATSGYVALPENELASVNGAYIDMDTTEYLVRNVFQQRGRVLDRSAPWVDKATSNILLQYTWVLNGLSQGYSVLGKRTVL